MVLYLMVWFSKASNNWQQNKFLKCEDDMKIFIDDAMRINKKHAVLISDHRSRINAV